MSEDRELEGFYQRLRADVMMAASASDDPEPSAPDFKENAFTRLVVEHLDELGILENPQVCHCEFSSRGAIAKANGYAISDEEDECTLLVTLYLDQNEQTTLPMGEYRRLVARAARFYIDVTRGAHDRMERSSDAWAMASRIHEVSGRVHTVRVLVLTDGLVASERLSEFTLYNLSAKVDIWDLRRLHRSMGAGVPRDEIDIDLEALCGAPLGCLPMPQAAPDYSAYLCLLPGDALFRIYDEYGPRVLEFNVRSFLQSRGKVNRGIRRTIVEEPHHFLAFNNGIAATADAVEQGTTPEGRPGIRRLRGFQIVNGGQTTASIHRAARDKVDISQVLVPVKITVVRSGSLVDMVQKIAQSANTQNPIGAADFSSNHPFHVAVQRLAETLWIPGEEGRWFYERARGQYQDARFRAGPTGSRGRKDFDRRSPPARKFTKTDLAKYVNSWEQHPHIVSRGGQKNFLAFQESVERRGPDWRPDADYFKKLAAKAILFKRTEAIVRKEGFQAFRANIIAYTVAYLSWRTRARFDLLTIWSHQELSQELEDLLRNWSHPVNEAIIESAGSLNITEWCKKEGCWEAIRALRLAASSKPLRELGGEGVPEAEPTDSPGRPTTDDLRNIALCKMISAESWLHIHGWGLRTGELQKWQYGIAHTLSGMAASEWPKEPSVKQARYGVQILQRAADEGLLAPDEVERVRAIFADP